MGDSDIRLTHLLVVTGLVPVTPLRLPQCLPKRDGRDKPGHDRRNAAPSLPQKLIELADFLLLSVEILCDALVEPRGGFQHGVLVVLLADKGCSLLELGHPAIGL